MLLPGSLFIIPAEVLQYGGRISFPGAPFRPELRGGWERSSMWVYLQVCWEYGQLQGHEYPHGKRHLKQIRPCQNTNSRDLTPPQRYTTYETLYKRDVHRSVTFSLCRPRLVGQNRVHRSYPKRSMRKKQEWPWWDGLAASVGRLCKTENFEYAQEGAEIGGG